MATPNDSYDTPWKDAVTRYFPQFMAFYFPQAHAQIDWSQPHRFLEQELAQLTRDASLGRRLADKLVEVCPLGGGQQWLLVHLEVQGQRDSRFAERMFTYNYRIFDRYRRPVVSLALLADDRPGWKPDCFAYRALGCSVGIHFPVVKLHDFTDRAGQLLADPNPFALVTAAYLAARQTKGDDARRAAEKLCLLRRLCERDWDRQAIIDLIAVIDWIMRLPEELERALRSRVEQEERSRLMPYITSFERLARLDGRREGLQEGLQEGRQRGLQEGLREGLREGQLQVLSQQLRRRFGALPAQVEQRLAGATTSELLAWSEAFVDAATLDEVFQRRRVDEP